MYDFRRIVLLVIGFIFAFFVFMVISFYLYPIINPEVEYQGGPSLGEIGYNSIDFTEFGPEVVARIKNERDVLQRRLDQSLAKDRESTQRIDSLLSVAAEFERQLNVREMQIASLQETESTVEDELYEKMRAMFNLDEDELAPIVNRLSDRMLFEIYTLASIRQRELMLRSLEPIKAAALLRRVSS